MAWVLAERLRDERVDEGDRLSLRVHAAANCNHVRVVVLAAKFGCLEAPGERRAHARDLIGGDLFAISRAADDDAQRPWLGHNRLRGREAERGVVVLRVVLEGPVVDDVVPLGSEVLDEGGLEFKARVVRSDVKAHSAIVPATS